MAHLAIDPDELDRDALDDAEAVARWAIKHQAVGRLGFEMNRFGAELALAVDVVRDRRKGDADA